MDLLLSHPVTSRLLDVMDAKTHWAYPHLQRPGLSRAQLLLHFQHEHAVYVRDFPVLLARALGQVPPLSDVRAALAENLYEEQTGGLSGTASHPELFLRMMAGLGFERPLFDDGAVPLHPSARAYKDWLVETSAQAPWQAAVALLTIFVEGSIHERAELAGSYRRPSGEEAIVRHPLVVHYGCPEAAMELARAHAAVEGGHRADAWRIVTRHVRADDDVAEQVVATCRRALEMWLEYRDGVAERMGLDYSRPSAKIEARQDVGGRTTSAVDAPPAARAVRTSRPEGPSSVTTSIPASRVSSSR
jgi:pyrroloquinoline quinone (PQQ) biosynthesis protein C